MVRYKFFILLFLAVNTINAQFLNEIGVFGGGSNYSGDIGNEIYIYPNSFAGSIIYRRNLNTRVTLRGTLSFYPITDDDQNSFNLVRQQRGIRFTNTLSEVALGVELNYFDYDITNYEYSYTPYLFFEVNAFSYKEVSSITNGTKTFTSKIGYAIPMGIGFKSRITRNWGYSLELRARYALADDLDFNNPEFPELNVGNPKTNDWYFFTGLGVTYSFTRPPCAVKPRY